MNLNELIERVLTSVDLEKTLVRANEEFSKEPRLQAIADAAIAAAAEKAEIVDGSPVYFEGEEYAALAAIMAAGILLGAKPGASVRARNVAKALFQCGLAIAADTHSATILFHGDEQFPAKVEDHQDEDAPKTTFGDTSVN